MHLLLKTALWFECMHRDMSAHMKFCANCFQTFFYVECFPPPHLWRCGVRKLALRARGLYRASLDSDYIFANYIVIYCDNYSLTIQCWRSWSVIFPVVKSSSPLDFQAAHCMYAFPRSIIDWTGSRTRR